jgi:hypothetical protein
MIIICIIDIESVIAYAFQQVVNHTIIHVGLGETIIRRCFTVNGIGWSEVDGEKLRIAFFSMSDFNCMCM